MKKVLLVLGALVMTLSGVAAVSAYEAHIINVTAHVENALEVTESIDFGTVFPEEWFTKDASITTSISFCADEQTRVGDIYFKVYAAWKPVPGTDPVEYYHWLGEALYLGFYPDDGVPPVGPPANLKAGDLVNVGAAPVSQPGSKPVLGGAEFLVTKYPLPPDESFLVIGLDVPVFEGYWNEHTDVATKPSGLSGPSYEIPEYLDPPTNLIPNPAWNPDGVDLGVDIIIQVTRIE